MRRAERSGLGRIVSVMADDDSPKDQLAKTNALLAEWAARSVADSDRLIERFEGMGYAVRGKSADEIAEVLKHPPARAGDGD